MTLIGGACPSTLSFLHCCSLLVSTTFQTDVELDNRSRRFILGVGERTKMLYLYSKYLREPWKLPWKGLSRVTDKGRIPFERGRDKKPHLEAILLSHDECTVQIQTSLPQLVWTVIRGLSASIGDMYPPCYAGSLLSS